MLRRDVQHFARHYRSKSARGSRKLRQFLRTQRHIETKKAQMLTNMPEIIENAPISP